jgi:hypothetical protein
VGAPAAVGAAGCMVMAGIMAGDMVVAADGVDPPAEAAQQTDSNCETLVLQRVALA